MISTSGPGWNRVAVVDRFMISGLYRVFVFSHAGSAPFRCDVISIFFRMSVLGGCHGQVGNFGVQDFRSA